MFLFGITVFWAFNNRPVTHVLIKSLCHWWKLGWVEKLTSFEFHDDRTELLLLRMTLSIGAGGLVNSDQTRNNQRISYKTNFATSKLNHDVLWFLGSCHFLDYYVICICLVDSTPVFDFCSPPVLDDKDCYATRPWWGTWRTTRGEIFHWWSFPNSDIVVFKKSFSKFLIIFKLNEGEAASVSAVPEVVLQQSPAGPAHQVFIKYENKAHQVFWKYKSKAHQVFWNIKIKPTKSFEYIKNH